MPQVDPHYLALPNSAYVMNDTLHVIYMYMFYICLLFIMFYVVFIYFFTLKISASLVKSRRCLKVYVNSLTLRHKRITCSTREIRTRGGGEKRRGGGCGIKKVIMLIILSVDER